MGRNGFFFSLLDCWLSALLMESVLTSIRVVAGGSGNFSGFLIGEE